MKSYRKYSVESLRGIQEYYKIALEGITHYWPVGKLKSKETFVSFRSQEITRLKAELNAIWKELIVRKLTEERPEG